MNLPLWRLGLNPLPSKIAVCSSFSVLGEVQLVSRDWLLCSKVILCRRQEQVDGGVHVPCGSMCRCSDRALADREGVEFACVLLKNIPFLRKQTADILTLQRLVHLYLLKALLSKCGSIAQEMHVMTLVFLCFLGYIFCLGCQ